MGVNEGFEKIIAGLPLATYRAGETVLAAGSRSGRLLILKSGAVVILEDSVEIARVEEAGAVFGELSALLDLPHTADVRALKKRSFMLPMLPCPVGTSCVASSSEDFGAAYCLTIAILLS